MATTQQPHFFNRELSWIEFNQRVLAQATNASLPLLERLKFIAIVASNLDEFFMVRVGGLQMARREGRRRKDAAGLSPVAQLQRVNQRTRQMFDDLELFRAVAGGGFCRQMPPSGCGYAQDRLRPHRRKQ